MLNPVLATHTIRDAKRVPLIKPAKTGSDWKGVPHAKLLAELAAGLRSRGWSPAPAVVHLSRSGMDMAAAVAVGGTGIFPRGEFTPTVGLAVSNDTRRKLTWFSGVAGSGYGVVSDSFPAGHRYTTHFDLDAEIDAAVERWEYAARRLPKNIDRLSRRKMTADTAMTVLNRLLTTKINKSPVVRSDDVPAVVHEWTTGDRTAWSLVAAASRAAGNVTPVTQLDCLLAVWRAVASPNDPGEQ